MLDLGFAAESCSAGRHELEVMFFHSDRGSSGTSCEEVKISPYCESEKDTDCNPDEPHLPGKCSDHLIEQPVQQLVEFYIF